MILLTAGSIKNREYTLMAKGLKVLNLYAGIGGNRKLWEDVEVTAVELNPKIAAIYQDFFPKDKVIVGDAHQYLLEHFEKFDFIWASPPCPTHSRPAFIATYNKDGSMAYRPKYPDMKLYEEILLVKCYFKGKFCIENVIGFYEPLIKPHELANHYFWTNFHVSNIPHSTREHYGGIEKLQERKQFNIGQYSGIDKIKTLRNCVEPEVGLHILNESKIDLQPELFRNI